MPTLSMFFRIIIRMYYVLKERNTPHIHVYYQGESGVVNIDTCELMNGKLPAKTIKIGSCVD